jgi:DNA ligase (NAD+)
MNSIRKLEIEILKHKELYYSGKAVISDEEYDLLEEKLRKLDPRNSVLSLVGTSVQGVKIEHEKKMLSLEKTYKEDELVNWIGNNVVASTFKIDGVSCSLIYTDGHLKMGKTRGDGFSGEDITEKVKWVKSIPKTISMKSKIEVRGELFCSDENFYDLSKTMEEKKLNLPMSQRNIVAGLVGRKDNIYLCSYIQFKAFDIIGTECKTEDEKNNLLNALNFNAAEITIHTDNKNIKKTIQEAEEFMLDGDYLIDGLVWSYNDLKLHDELGETAHHPRYRMAYKFAGETKDVIIDYITWAVSRNGIVTPVAVIVPTVLSGATISRVTLHNFGRVKQFKLKKGDKIQIIRSGEVIPKFLSVIESSANIFETPTKCPSCNSELTENEIRLLCVNDNCPGKNKEVILNYVMKIGIEDLNEKRVEEMINKKVISTISDLYRISHQDLLKLDKVKDKLADKLYKAIQESKNVDLKKFLSALGLTGGAYNKCERVVNAGFNSLEKIKNATPEKLQEIDGFAEKSSQDFCASIIEKRKLIEELESLGFQFTAVEIKDNPIKSKKICITGALGRKRTEIEDIIRKYGGLVVGSVSKHTDFLLTNEQNSTSSKFVKAQELKIYVISEDDFLKLVGE